MINKRLNKKVISSAALFITSFLFGTSNSYANSNFDINNFRTGEVVQLGTLYIDEEKQLRPSNPWGVYYKTNGDSDVLVFNGYSDQTISIRDTDSDEAYKIQWVQVQDGDKKLLISDRNLLLTTSEDHLEERGLLHGKTVVIDNNIYNLRVLSGGDDSAVETTYFQGGTEGNEWDKYISNVDNIPGLPTTPPNIQEKWQLDETLVESESNKLWNWFGIFSWAPERYNSMGIARGYYSPKMWTYVNMADVGMNTGYRPVLEYIGPYEADEIRDAVEKAEQSRDTQDISDARDLVNNMPESPKKDAFQDRLDAISPNLTFDRETASANLDVYIKSENMLSLSLNTNSVSFEEYSGAAPMELKEAVNITINSSLPYDLNAYMPSEITSSDGSKTMPIDILNIKEGTKDDYQTFADTTNKVVLKSYCIEGNNINHKIDLKLDNNNAHVADIYKTVIKFEAEQK